MPLKFLSLPQRQHKMEKEKEKNKAQTDFWYWSYIKPAIEQTFWLGLISDFFTYVHTKIAKFENCSGIFYPVITKR